MVGILLITHNALGQSLVACAQHVTGRAQPKVACIGIQPQDDFESAFALALRTAIELDQGDGVLVLTDIYGATPANIARKLLMPGRVEAIAGVNLPMLVRALTHRDEPLPSVVARALSGAIECVVSMQAPTE